MTSPGTQVFFPLDEEGQDPVGIIALPKTRTQPPEPLAEVIGGPVPSEVASGILAAARAPVPGHATTHIILRFVTKSPFEGKSYGLALALADRLLLEGKIHTKDSPNIFATGIIDEIGDGEIWAVDSQSFGMKVETVAKAAGTGDVFVFPADNWRDASADIRQTILDMRRAGITVAQANHIEELAFLWTTPEKPGHPEAPTFLAPVLYGVLAAAAAVFVLLSL